MKKKKIDMKKYLQDWHSRNPEYKKKYNKMYRENMKKMEVDIEVSNDVNYKGSHREFLLVEDITSYVI